MIQSIVEAVRRFAQEKPEHAAVIAQEQTVTYRELWQEVQGFAAFIRAAGVPEGSVIAVKASASIEFAVSCLAIHLSGHVHAPLEKTVSSDGLAELAAELNAGMVVSDVDVSGNFIHVDTHRVRQLARENACEWGGAMPQRDDLCDLLFTTGSTGKSKGVLLTHRAVVSVTQNVQYGAHIPADNVYLIPSPINHAGAIRKLYVSLLTGTTAVLLDGFKNLRKFYAYINDYHVTSILMPPAAVRMILLLSAKELAKYADQIDHIHTGSAAFPEADKEKLSEILPKSRLYFAYGSSEAGCSCLYDYSAERGLISCIGKPNVNSEVLIVDDDRQVIESSKDRQGLIAVRGDTVMSGYYNEPDLTAEVLQDGVVYTNDIGYIDENGFVFMLGRRGDVINVGGLKIAPTEVENVVMRFPGIADCACFGVEDRLNGTVPKLSLVAEKGVEPDLTELRAFMRRHLEEYKIPRLMVFVEELPKTYNGKLDRKKLK